MLTQLPRVPSLIPSSFATRAIGRDVSITILTASSLNSGEKLFFGRGNYFTFPDIHPNGWTVRKARGTSLGFARGEVGGLRELRELALGRRAAVLLLEPRGAGAQVFGDGLAAGGEQPHHLPRDTRDLEAVAVVAGGPLQPEPLGEGFLEVLGDDRGDGSD